MYAPDSTAYFWNSPSTVVFILLTSTPSESRARRSSQAQPHRHRGELREVGQPPRVRVARQPAPELLAEPVEVGLGHAAVEEGAGVDCRGGVAVHEDLFAEPAVALAPEEVVEADLVERR